MELRCYPFENQPKVKVPSFFLCSIPFNQMQVKCHHDIIEIFPVLPMNQKDPKIYDLLL
jgi:hypothetical protein